MDKVKRVAWNKGLNKNNDNRVKKYGNTLKKRINSGEVIPSFTGKKHKKETIELMKKNSGGYRKGSGRGKSGWYKGYWCDSTYELCWLIYQLDNGKTPIRITESYDYFYNNEKHSYHPDFLLNDIIYEIKGYETKQDIEKYKSVDDKKLVIIRSVDMKFIFEYIEKMYKTNKYYELYDYTKKSYEDINYNLCECGNKKWKASKMCITCTNRINNLKLRRVERPPYEQLIKEIDELGYCGVGRKYGVTDNSIRKWKKYYEIDM